MLIFVTDKSYFCYISVVGIKIITTLFMNHKIVTKMIEIVLLFSFNVSHRGLKEIDSISRIPEQMLSHMEF